MAEHRRDVVVHHPESDRLGRAGSDGVNSTTTTPSCTYIRPIPAVDSAEAAHLRSA